MAAFLVLATYGDATEIGSFLFVFFHRYPKRKIDCLRFVMCPLPVPVFQGFFFAAAINSMNETNKAGGMPY